MDSEVSTSFSSNRRVGVVTACSEVVVWKTMPSQAAGQLSLEANVMKGGGGKKVNKGDGKGKGSGTKGNGKGKGSGKEGWIVHSGTPIAHGTLEDAQGRAFDFDSYDYFFKPDDQVIFLSLIHISEHTRRR